MREGHHQRTDQHNDQMDEKRRTGVKEGTHHDGYNGIRNDIDIEQAHAHTQLR